MNYWQHNLVLIGGWNGTAEKTYNDVMLFSLETEEWSTQPTSGRGVPPLYGHSTTMVNSKMFVYGGNWQDVENAGGFTMSNEMRVLDTESWVWSRSVIRGDLVPPRYGHSTIAVGSHLVVFGGWAGLSKAVQSVKAEASTSMSASQSMSVGSSNASSVVAAPAEVYAFDTEKFEWSTPVIQGNTPSSRYYHSATMVGTKICFFAGMDNANPKADFHVLETKTAVYSEEGEGEEEWDEEGAGEEQY
jgi:hypothetical protein